MLFRRVSGIVFLLGLVIATPEQAPADALSFAGRGSMLQGRVAMVDLRARSPTRSIDTTPASLFGGDAGHSFFAPYPARFRPPVRALTGDLQGDRTALDRLRHLIAAAEAGAGGYDAVQHGARHRPPRPPTDMRIADIYAWINATPGQPHAIGRYQFIPATLRRLVDHLGLDPRTRFSPQVQDALADVLLAEAGLAEMASGQLDRRRFMNNLAKIWAGLPTSTGRSHYDGFAGNRATLSWARFEAEMDLIFPG